MTETKEKLNPVSPIIKMFGGSLGGIAESVCLQPLDTVKTRMQLDRTGKYKGIFNTGKIIVHEEGAKALYKGLTPFIAHLTLKYALRMGTHSWYLSALTGGKRKADSRDQFIAGMGAGITEAILIVTPFEVVKTRLQKQLGFQNVKYKNPIHAVQVMVKEEGVGALWKGCTPTVVRQGTNQAFNFMSVNFINRRIFGKEEGDGVTLAPWKTFASGVLGGAVGPCLNMPMDVVKTRMMAQETIKGQALKYRSALHCVQVVAREEGPAALWRGLGPRLLRLAPGQGIMWTVVNQVTPYFERQGR